MRNAIMILSAVILAFAGSVVPASSVEAQAGAAPTEEAMAGARAAYARGEAEFEAGNFAAAEAAFLQAYDFIPNPIVLIGAAQAREQQGDLQGAVEFFRRYLAESPDASDRQQWEERIAGLIVRPGTLAVNSDPPGAAISVDGEATGQATPAELSLSPGEHTVTLSLGDHLDDHQTVSVPYGGRVEHEIELSVVNGGGDEIGGGVGDPGAGAGAADITAVRAGLRRGGRARQRLCRGRRG